MDARLCGGQIGAFMAREVDPITDEFHQDQDMLVVRTAGEPALARTIRPTAWQEWPKMKVGLLLLSDSW